MGDASLNLILLNTADFKSSKKINIYRGRSTPIKDYKRVLNTLMPSLSWGLWENSLGFKASHEKDRLGDGIHPSNRIG